jgi:dephospho-CoA kinase
MLIIGLTGGIASGKSTVSALFEKKHVPIIDTDQLAKALVLPNTPTYEAIRKKCGDSMLLSDGMINRKALREKIFEDRALKSWLEALLHPQIRQLVREKVAELTAPYCLIAIPLLAENYPIDYINRVLVIDTPEEIQIQRVMERDKISESLAKKILRQQAPRDLRLKIADDIIHNQGNIAKLYQQVDALHEQYLLLSRYLKYTHSIE